MITLFLKRALEVITPNNIGERQGISPHRFNAKKNTTLRPFKKLISYSHLLNLKKPNKNKIENTFDEQNFGQQSFIKKVDKIIEENYSDATFNVDKLASIIALSPRQLQRKFRICYKQTPSKYIQCYRLERSLKLLQQGEPINRTVYSVGFLSHSYFCRCFKAKFKLPPSKYLETTTQ